MKKNMKGMDQKSIMMNFNSRNYKKLVWNREGGMKEKSEWETETRLE
jgi:hypothetical protein